MQGAAWQVQGRMYRIFDRRSWGKSGLSEGSPAEGF